MTEAPPRTPAIAGSPGAFLFRVVIALLLACAVVAASSVLVQGRLLLIAAPVFLASIFLGGLWFRDMRSALVFGAIFAIAYNRQYYSFDDALGDYGSRGLYWVPADALYLALFALLLVSLALPRRGDTARSLPLGFVAPLGLFILVLFLSALQAADLAPALFELARVLKFLLIVLMLRALMTERMAWAILVALAGVALSQFLLGAMEVVRGTGGSGLSEMAQQDGEMSHRAHGTLGHPNFLAPFLLTFATGFVAIGLAVGPRGLRYAALAVGVAACLTVFLTQSRAPSAALIGALAGMSVHLMLRRRYSLFRLIGVSVLMAILAASAAAPLSHRILDRLQGDFADSISFRDDYNEAAVAIWRSAPILGIGPNHFVSELPRHHPLYAQINEELEEHRLEASFRSAAPVHNLYLLILAETGAIGLSVFVVVLLALARDFWRAGTGPPADPFVLFYLGCFWGLLALLAQQTVDYSLWWDHHFNLIAVLGALALYVRARNEGYAR